MREYIDSCTLKEYIGVNYEDNACEAYKYIYPSKNENYVDPDLYSPLLYKTWGELLKKKGVIESYSIVIKDYRYIIEVEYVYKECRKTIILGSDGLLSVGKCVDDIREHRYVGGFALWPSHRGGINFRKNRYKDDIFRTLEDVECFCQNLSKYEGVIPERDYEWFNYLKEKGGFMDIFFFKEYKLYKDLLAFENYRTKEINEFLNN